MNLSQSFKNLSFSRCGSKKAQDILSRIENIKKEAGSISFCGTFKSGKSSLINSLIGVKLLPTRATTATAVITRLYYSENPAASVIKENSDGSSKKEAITFDEIPSYILLKKKSLNGVVLSNVKEVCIGIPSPFLKCGIVIVDTPGLYDDKELTGITLKELGRTDLAVMVYDATQFMSYNEKGTLIQINELLGGNVIFAVNKMDATDDKESIIEAAELYFSRFGNSIVGRKSIFYTCSNDANPQIAQLQNWLTKLVNSHRMEEVKCLSRISIIRSELETKLNEALNDWDSYRAEYEKKERLHTNKMTGMVRDNRSKMMQLSTRLNNVRYNLYAYLNPFKDMCISLARSERLLESSTFDSDLLAQCIHMTNIGFVREFVKKLKQLFNEFGVNFDVDFVPRTYTTSEGIDHFLTSVHKKNSGFWGNMVFDIVGKDTYRGISDMMSGGKTEKYMTAYVLAIEDEISNLKNQINCVLDDVEQRVLAYANTYKPDTNLPPDLHQTYALMNEADEFVKWCRNSITQVNNLLKE